MDGIGIIVYRIVNKHWNKNWKNNIGDWYQTAAACYIWWIHFGRVGTFYNFLEECIRTQTMNGLPIIWIDRDNLSAANCKGCKKVVTICNGWWMCEYKYASHFDFPPPTWMHPLYVSVHIGDKRMMTPKTIAHFKEYQPIGCRDKSTAQMLEALGISSYFSGCLTMTLNLNDAALGFTPTLDYSDTHVFVDMPVHFKGADLYCKVTQEGKYDTDPKWILQSVQHTYNLFHAKTITTHRLHVWLPLLSNGKSVILWDARTYRPCDTNHSDYNAGQNNRFAGLIELQEDREEREKIKCLLMEDCLKRLQFL
jgi:hypothetical protein